MTDRQTSTRRPNGFTLTELLMVIVILGILAALATPRVYQTVARAKVKQPAGVLAADLEQAVALAGRTRKPVVVAKEPATTYTIRDRVASGTGTLRLQRVIALTGDQGWLKDRNAYYRERRDLVVNGVRAAGLHADTPAAAMAVLEELEETARLYLLLRGQNPRCLTPDQVAELEMRFPRD